MSDAIDRYADRRSPPRPPETQVGTPAPGRAQRLPIAIWDGSRFDSVYTGHLIQDQDGGTGDAVQWIFSLDDSGVDDLMPVDKMVVLMRRVPAWAETGFSWQTGAGDKYLASLSPWSAL